MAMLCTNQFFVPDQRDTGCGAPDINALVLPRKFPRSINTPLAWCGEELADESQFIYNLTSDDIQEIRQALETFKSYGLDGDLVTKKNFPLPRLGRILEKICAEIHDGQGFFLIRGLDAQKHSVEDGMVIFLGIQSYIAEQRARQDDKGNMIVHIISDSTPFCSPKRALHTRYSKSGISFHNEEFGDILAWQTRCTAANGGKCIISSAYTVYNILAAERPDLIRVLARADWPFAFPQFRCRPILFYHDNRLIINFSRTALLGSASYPRSPDLPSLTQIQREALDAIESIAVATQLEFETQAGDMHFVNNLALLHRRDEFVDYEEGTEKKQRHLVRMRLRNEEMAWKLPAELEDDWREAFDVGGEPVWHIEPMPEAYFPLRKYPI